MRDGGRGMSVNRIVATMLCILMMVLLQTAWGVQVTPFRVAESNAERIVLEIASPAPQIERVLIGGESFNRISIEGAEFTAEDGHPELPLFSGMVAIPPNASYNLSYEITQSRRITNVRPSPVTGRSGSLRLSEVYQDNTRYPQEQVKRADDGWMRDFRVLPLQVCPFSWDSAGNALTHYEKIRITIDLSYPASDGGPLSYTTLSPAFTKLYEAQILNFADYRYLVYGPQSARILIIHGANTEPTFISQLQDFVTWKRQKGFEVSVASTSVAGTSSTAIKSYIQSQYDNPATRPDYLIIVGDVTGNFAVPTFYIPEDEYLGEGDYPYTLLSGNDMLGDIFVGRMSAENVSQLVTLFNKVYTYEKNVNLSPSLSSWMNRMLIIGDPRVSGISCVYTGQFVHEISAQANPEYEFIENYDSGFPTTINGGLNQGVGFFVYRGFYGVSGWSPSTSSLFNGFKLPHSVILTCMTGEFATGTSLSEEFTRMGTSATPSGAVTCVGMATGGTHTSFNNALVSGIMSGIMCHGMRTMGEATLSAKLYLYSTYLADQPEHTIKLAHWCNLMGDPTLEVWVGLAKQLTLDAPEEIPLGTTVFEVRLGVSAEEPVEGVCVTAYSASQDAVVAKAFTGPNGIAVLNLPPALSSDLLITASKHDYKPIQRLVTMDGAGSLNYLDHLVIDDGSSGSSGNADGIAHASESIALQVELFNTTDSTLSGLNAVLSTNNPWVQITSASSSYPAIAPGSTSTASLPFIFNLDPALPPVEDIRFELDITASGSIAYQIVFYLHAYNASLSVAGHTVIDADNQVLDPGDTCGLFIYVENAAGYPARDLMGELHSLNSMLLVTDSISYFGSISAHSGLTSVDGFQVYAMPELVAGMQMPMRLRLYNAEGFEQNCLFTLQIGTVSQNTPLGPDEYGYLIYDVTDTAYQDCPVYDWVEIAPTLGGVGTLIPDLIDTGSSSYEGDGSLARVLKVLDLPFTFRFYGIDYDQITVCVNGFIALGVTNNGEFRNAQLPGGQGPSPMIAAFWDDLCLRGTAGIYQYYDEPGHRYIIQYQNLKNGFDNIAEETFQVIFYDPVYYHSGLGDGNIKIQYKTFNNVDTGSTGHAPWQGNYCTIGIKDHTNTRGLQYTFNNIYPQAAAPLMDERALFITTIPYYQQHAHLVLDDLILVDDNQNGILEPGEQAEIGVLLHNRGFGDATGISVNFSSQNQYATVQVGQSVYNDIQSFGSAVNRTPFIVSVEDSCSDGTVLSFLCEVNTPGASWSYPVSIRVQKPAVSYGGFYLIDTDGNNNGLLEPGENAILVVNFANNSALPATNLIANLACSNSFITLEDESQLIGYIPPRRTLQALFRFNLASAAALGTNLTFNLSFTFDQGASQNVNITLRTGSTGLYHDFESSSGNFVSSPATNAWQWGTSAEAGSYSGTKVWGTLLNQQYPNDVSWTLTSPSFYLGSNSFLEFWHYQDMQSGFDGGNVKITINNSTWNLLTPEGGYPYANVSALGEPGFSGSSGWSRVRFDLSEYIGNSVRFRWTFASDSSVQGHGWYMDDVITIGLNNYAGLLTGEVSAIGSPLNYSSAWVTNQTGIAVNPDAAGLYKLYLPVGLHTVQASALGFSTITATDLVLAPSTPLPLQDFLLIEYKPVINFGYTHTDNSILLSWEPPSEPFYLVTGYKVTRRMNAGAFQTVLETTDTFYSEVFAEHGSYQYYVQALYVPGESLPTEVLSVNYPFLQGTEDNPNPMVTRLQYNYPNPFNIETAISFDLAVPGNVQLRIFNLRGQLVNTLCNTELGAGRHSFLWHGQDSSNARVASGIYFYRLSAPKYTQTRKMLLLK